MVSSTFSWRGIFDKLVCLTRAAELKLKKVDVQFIDGRAVAPHDLIQNGIKWWDDYLVGFFVGKRIAFPTMRKFLESRWKCKEPFTMHLRGNLFYIQIKDEILRNSILSFGPLFIFGRIFVLQ